MVKNYNKIRNVGDKGKENENPGTNIENNNNSNFEEFRQSIEDLKG